MAWTIRRSATIQLRRPAARAMTLFTPEGERAWAGPHWDPRYPAPDRTLGDGAVFLTEREATATVGVMVEHLPHRVRYVRVTPDVYAGTVTVAVIESGAEDCRVEVTYDLTALSERGASDLDRFGTHYDAEIDGWATAINAATEG
jgi:hypothetical protein